MAHDQTSEGESYFLLRMRLVAKITLIISAASCLGTVLALFFITGDPGNSYGTIFRSYSLSRQYLAPALLVVGLVLVLLSGVVIWRVSHRTSFHIAGPLYRFARKLETLIDEHGLATPVPKGQEDCLKQEEQQINRSIARLQAHYSAMRAATKTALAQIDAQQPPAAAIEQLKELDRATRL